MRRRRETVRDLDLIATATDAKALIDAFTDADWVAEVAAKGGRRRPSSRRRASASTSASYRPSATATCSSTSPARRITTSRCARRPCSRASRSPSTASPRSRAARCTRSPTRGPVRVPRLPVHPARAARERGRARGGAGGELPVLVEERRSARRPALAHDVVGGRRSTIGGDGARPRRRAATPTSRSPTTRTTCARAASRRRRGRSTPLNAKLEAVPPAARGRGEHPRRTGRSTCRTRRSPSCDWVVASIHAAFGTSPTERVIAAMENPHVDVIGHLTGRKIDKRAPMRHRPRAGVRGGGRDRNRARDQLPARPAGSARRRRASGG